MKKYKRKQKLSELQASKFFDLKAVNAFINDLIFWVRQKKMDPFDMGKQMALVIGDISGNAIDSYQDNIKFLKGLKSNL
jgi:hypothetical protein